MARNGSSFAKATEVGASAVHALHPALKYRAIIEKSLRVRGLVAVRFTVTIEALGLNSLRCIEALSAAPRALITTLFGLKSSATAFVCSLYAKIMTFVSIDTRQVKFTS